MTLQAAGCNAKRRRDSIEEAKFALSVNNAYFSLCLN